MGALQPRIFNGVSWGASVAAIPSRRLRITYTKKRLPRYWTACSCWREPLGEEGLLLRGDRVSVHLTVPGYCMYIFFFFLLCGPGMRLFDDTRTHTLSHTHSHTPTHMHALVHVPNTNTRPHTRKPWPTQTWGTGCDIMEPPPMPNSIADAILLRAGGGDR